ncbi:MAG: M16 family metallopeptidase [Vicinamibacterales bacterium]
MHIPHSKRVLSNGLQVVVHEDHRCPIVAINIWYHVGSKDEVPGQTGLAHLFEHLMFEGSEHNAKGYFAPLQRAGALLNGSTNADRTNYWEVVPSNAVDLALWMESDRMGFLLPALTQARFETQREVVLNERRQNYENRPYGMAPAAILGALYPPAHPYHWLTIGAAEDLRSATVADAAKFFQRYYHPGNASLAMAGDIRTEEAMEKASDYFDGIVGCAPPARTVLEAALDSEVRLHLEDRVELPRLYIAWHSPALFADGDAEMDLVAEILGGGKSSRLYRSMVYRDQMATDISASQNSREMSGFFQVVATAASGRSAAELEAAARAEIESLAANGPTEDELERARTRAEAALIYGLQTVGGFGGRADQLNSYNVYLGDPDGFERDLARYRAVTVESVRSLSARLLCDRPSVTLAVVPRGRLEAGLPGSSPAVLS